MDHRVAQESARDAGIDNDLDGRGIGVADFGHDGLLESRDGSTSGWAPPSLLPMVFLLLGASPPDPAAREELLWRHRNLGKAFYENPTTQNQAVAELKPALDLAPGSRRRQRLNYGLALLKAGKAAEGIAELQKVQQQAPDIPHTWFNLGIAYKRDSKFDESIAQLEGMAARVPNEPITHYNLGTLYKLTEKPEQSLKEFETAALAPDLAGPALSTTTPTARQGARKMRTASWRSSKRTRRGRKTPRCPKTSSGAGTRRFSTTSDRGAKGCPRR